MKILVITALYPPHHLGGYDLRCREISEHLQSRGHEVLVITSRYGVEQPQLEASIARVLHLEPSNSLWQRIRWDTQDLRFIAKSIKSYQPDVIHLWHMAQLARTIYPFLARQSVPIVYDEGGIGLLLAWQRHGRWLSFCEGQSQSWIKKMVKLTLCRTVSLLTGGVLPIRWRWPENMFIYFNSAFTKERHHQAGVPINGSKVIHSGIELSRFPYRKHSLSHESVHLLIPGRVHPEKGVEDALEALHLLVHEFPKRKFHLEIVGATQDISYQQILVKRAMSYGLEDQVRFSDQLPYARMYQAYQRANICLLLTRIPESFSRVPLEAMACGTVVITTAAGGGAEVVKDGKTGLVVPIANPKAIVAAVKRLLDNDDDLYGRISTAARDTIEHEYAIQRVVIEIEQVLKNAIQNYSTLSKKIT